MGTSLTSPVTGAAQSGLTSPTYTLSVDVAPDTNGRQYAVTALGGTQTNVLTNTPGTPFTITIVRPKAFKTLGARSSIGLNSSFPRNNWKVIVRKSVLVDTYGQNPSQVAVATLDIAVPAGVETADVASMRAMLSLLIGSLNQFSASFGDSLATGVM
ncbi:TPA_asm: coat protein [ssRNA phage Gerhypos.3_27]|uniref:Coat protein n=2 Tax=Norzivirales TaxID=2842247 RepID=A0A8S5KXB5_9VIRU|nr:coat protein [ssRNA phage Gerhypos.3_27]QDH87993.1 MAG: hypothetical protein H3Bulk42499_000002 [Leviviridae sp.]DAD50190.1 TPA_asm: coat protein [ssRNA phage Gerhypos.3_27]